MAVYENNCMPHNLEVDDFRDQQELFDEWPDSTECGITKRPCDGTENIRQRHVQSMIEEGVQQKQCDIYDLDVNGDCKETRLTLMEEILLLGLKDKEGYTSFWNDSISSGLRGAILIELGLRGRISLEANTGRRRNLFTRNVVVMNEQSTGDALLDESLQLIKANEPATVKEWIEYLSGESWNPMKLHLQLRQVRERVAKNLSEKGVCATEKQNFVIFDLTTHPLVDSQVKQSLLCRIQDSLLSRYSNDPHRYNPRLLSLIYLSHASDVLEIVLSHLDDSEFELAFKRVNQLTNLNYEMESVKEGTCLIMWAVFLALNN